MLKSNLVYIILLLINISYKECFSENSSHYLSIVEAYADTMIKYGRDQYGERYSPLFAECLDRKELKMFARESLQIIETSFFDISGVRSTDRMIAGGNPQHCINLYQILYALTDINHQKRYEDNANESLKFFLENCQNKNTGLFYWGEHAGWDFYVDKPIYNGKINDVHEFYRPWILWDRCWNLAPKNCFNFAVGLWEHQIGDKNTGEFSRHARISSHYATTEASYARHAGFYIETWAAAYEKTQDNVFASAIDVIISGLDKAMLDEGGMLVSGSKTEGSRSSSDISLAISLANSYDKLPDKVKQRAQDLLSKCDTNFIRAYQSRKESIIDSHNWVNAYGYSPNANRANVYMLRYRQSRISSYREAILDIADNYYLEDVNIEKTLWPGTIGDVIFLMIYAYELTGNKIYLNDAHRFAGIGIEHFLTKDSPLPKVTHVQDYYEAITRADTFMMALLNLWLVENSYSSNINLVYTDR